MGGAEKPEKGGTLFAGCSGYFHPDWAENVYPPGLSESASFQEYARMMPAVEMEETFYSLPSADTLDQWRDQAPEKFVYALELRRSATYGRHLKEPEKWLPEMLACTDRLRPHQGPILVRMPSDWEYRGDRLRQFLKTAGPDYRWAFEFRNPDWLRYETFDILRKHNASLCVHDLFPDHPQAVTADFIYLRFHGTISDRHKRGGAYGRDYLWERAQLIHAWLERGIDVYAFFRNVAGGQAMKDAWELQEMVRSLCSGNRMPPPPED